MKTLKVKITFTEDVLGTSSANEELHETYIASKAPDAAKIEEEIAALGADAIIEKGMTIFPRECGVPFIWDYQVKGFLKDSAQMLKKIPGTHCSTVKAYKKEIDGLIFPAPRKILLHMPAGLSVGRCQRPLRASTPQGERVALADSESVPAGTFMIVDFVCLTDAQEKLVRECLDYGSLRGFGQWRNSGKGRFVWEEAKTPSFE